MDPFAFIAVLFAAACHAAWNAAIKRGIDALAMTVAISLGATIVAAAALPFVGLPAAASWPWCVASVLVHLGYFAALAESYRAGDMGQVYPIARGSAPLMTAVVTTLFVGERLGLLGWCGIVLLVAGVILLSLGGGRALARLNGKAVGFALCDDGRPDRAGGGATRNQRPVRRDHCHRLSQGAAASKSSGRGADDRRRPDADPVVLS